MNYIIACLSSIILSILLTLQLIKLFEHIDNEHNTRLSLSNTIVIIICSTLFGILSPIFIWDNQYDTLKNSIEMLNITILFVYLLFQSYFDQKICMVYSSVSLIMIALEILYVIFMYINNYISIYGIYTLGVLIIPFVLYIISLFRGIGLGDVLIYLVISIYYIGSKQQTIASMLINIIVTNILFIVTSLIVKIIKKDKNNHQPLTIFISIVTLLFAIVKI